MKQMIDDKDSKFVVITITVVLFSLFNEFIWWRFDSEKLFIFFLFGLFILFIYLIYALIFLLKLLKQKKRSKVLVWIAILSLLLFLAPIFLGLILDEINYNLQITEAINIILSATIFLLSIIFLKNRK